MLSGWAEGRRENLVRCGFPTLLNSDMAISDSDIGPVFSPQNMPSGHLFRHIPFSMSAPLHLPIVVPLMES
jgi:hypothetical protein